MRTANYLFSKHVDDLAQMNAAQIAEIKSNTIQSAIDRYQKFSKELGQTNARQQYPLPDNK